MAPKVYGHQNDRPQPLLAVRALQEDPTLGQGELFLACAVGDVAAVERAIAADPASVHRTERNWQCPGCKDWLDMPPLVAVTHSSLLSLPAYCEPLRRCARLLLDAGADSNQLWKHGVGPEGAHPLSALYGAAGRNHDPELTRMLLDAGADPNDGESLYHSLERQNSPCTAMLLEAGARVEDANAIAHQLDFDNIEGLRQILHYAQSVSDRDLLWGIRRGRNREHIALLLGAGANPHARTHAQTQDGLSAYHYALQCGLREVAELLAEAGAGEVLAIEDQFVAACACSDEAMARGLLADHPDLFRHMSEAQLRQLPELTEAGNHRAVRLMVELGWPVTVRGGDWSATPLNLAVFQGNPDLARFLLEHGASWQERHGHGDNVCGTLSWASRNLDRGDYVGCARLLLEFGAPLFERNGEYSEDVEEFLQAERERRAQQPGS